MHTHVRASKHARTHAHTRTQVHALLVMVGRNEKKETTNQYAEEKRWVSVFNLRKESTEECMTERGREFHITDRPDVLKGFLLQDHPAHSRNTEDPNMEAEGREVKMK